MPISKKTAVQLQLANDEFMAAEQGLSFADFNSDQTQDPDDAALNYVIARRKRDDAYAQAEKEMDS